MSSRINGPHGRDEVNGVVRNEITTKPITTSTDIRTFVVDDESSQTQPQSASLNASAILHALRRNWLLGMVLGLLLSAPLAAVVWSIHNLEYTARAQIRISPQQSRLLFETADQSASANFKSYKNTQRQLILSPFLLNDALKKKY